MTDLERWAACGMENIQAALLPMHPWMLSDQVYRRPTDLPVWCGPGIPAVIRPNSSCGHRLEIWSASVVSVQVQLDDDLHLDDDLEFDDAPQIQTDGHAVAPVFQPLQLKLAHWKLPKSLDPHPDRSTHASSRLIALHDVASEAWAKRVLDPTAAVAYVVGLAQAALDPITRAWIDLYILAAKLLASQVVLDAEARHQQISGMALVFPGSQWQRPAPASVYLRWEEDPVAMPKTSPLPPASPGWFFPVLPSLPAAITDRLLHAAQPSEDGLQIGWSPLTSMYLQAHPDPHPGASLNFFPTAHSHTQAWSHLYRMCAHLGYPIPTADMQLVAQRSVPVLDMG